MEGHRNDDLSNRPTKVYSDDQLVVEIPETAHQISSGMFFCFVFFKGVWDLFFKLFFIMF